MIPAFTHCGGEVFWSGHPLNDHQIGRLAQLFDRETEIARRSGDLAHFRSARALRDELAAAVANRNLWQRASGPLPSHTGA